MRILMLSKACLVGSYQTKLESIAKHDDLELMVIVPPYWLDPAGKVSLERKHTTGYQLVVDPMRLNGHYHLHYYPRLKKRLSEFKPDILHIDEEPYNMATWKAMRDGSKIECRTLFFSWQNISRNYPWPFSSLEKSVINGADYAIMGNSESVEVWQGKGYTGPYRVIPQFGVSLSEFKRMESSTESSNFVIGAAGRRLVHEKGVDLIIKAAASLQGSWELRIAGEGPERQSLENLSASLGVSDKVKFDGIIPSTDMPAYLSKLDGLVLASRTMPNWKEQFGRVLVEAMACQVPVVGSDSGEIPNVIADAGMIFPEGDHLTLGKQLELLMRDEERRRELGEAGLVRVKDHYTQEKVAERTVMAYREMMIDNE